MNFSELAQIATQAAKVGGEVLQRHFQAGVTIRNKSTQGGKSYDLVTVADEESEQAIARYLHQHCPGHEILGEEARQDADTQSEHLWIIDPLDGTNNFAHRIEHFAVSVGYYHQGIPTVGAVFHPLHQDCYVAIRNGGAFRNDQAVRVSNVDSMNQAMIGCGFYYDRGDVMRRTLATIGKCFERDIHGIRRIGCASLDLCMVGCGMLDAFFEYQLSIWDFAAGALFVQEAGGKVSDTEGNPLPIGSTSMLATNQTLHPIMLDLVG